MPRIKRTSYLEFWPQPTESKPPKLASAPTTVTIDSLSQLETQPLSTDDIEAWAHRFWGVATGTVAGRLSAGRLSQEPPNPPIQQIPINALRRAAAVQRAREALARAMRHAVLYGISSTPLRVSLEMDQARETERIRERLMRGYVATDLEVTHGLRRLAALHDVVAHEAVPVPEQQEQAAPPRPDPKRKRYNYYEERQRHNRAPPPPSSLLSKLTRRIK